MSFKQFIRSRHFKFLVAKLLFTLVVMIWLFHKVDVSRVWRAMRDASPGPFLLGVLLCLTTVLIASSRWQMVLRIIQIHAPYWFLVGIAQTGQFFSMFLPGPAGDDFTRMLYIARFAKGRVGEACATVVIDRAIGLASVLLLAGACLPFHWHLLTSSRQTYWIALSIMMAGLVALAGMLVFFLVPQSAAERWAARWLPGREESSVHIRILRMWGSLCAGKAAIAGVLVRAIGTQLTVCAFYYLAGYAVGIRTPFAVWLGFVPVVLAANSFPMTVAGLGVREYLFILFLGVLAGVDEEHALSASLLAFAIIFLTALFGGLVYVVFRPRKTTEPAMA
ncbi:MAG TPA: lysylphosphatidylglycerol synthase transmembrane domain-containing protein [Verrucomicrobiaceae bacterium]|jgi:hypothetical protein